MTDLEKIETAFSEIKLNYKVIDTEFGANVYPEVHTHYGVVLEFDVDGNFHEISTFE